MKEKVMGLSHFRCHRVQFLARPAYPAVTVSAEITLVQHFLFDMKTGGILGNGREVACRTLDAPGL